MLETADPGRDGFVNVSNDNAQVGRDAFGFNLDYFAGDYQSVSNDMTMFPAGTATVTPNNLYNGNIGRMTTAITDPTTRDVLPLVNKYSYDQLNRLLESDSYEAIDAANNSWQSAGTVQYKNQFTYDANGNIITQVRWNRHGTQAMDNLSYSYNVNSAGQKLQNRLYHVYDASHDATANELPFSNGDYFTQTDYNTDNNYGYDAEGRLIRDDEEEIATIGWRVDGKVKSIDRTSGSSKKNLKFDYDAMGHRIAKHVYNSSNQLEQSTYYVLDAQGNAMGVYEREVDDVNSIVTYQLTENYIYGSNRLAVRNTDIDLLSTGMALPSSTYTTHDIGKKAFELTNHLGNVLSTVSDKPMPHTSGTTVDYFLADIRTASDYYPFGASMRERNFTLAGAEKFRFGFNNMEADDEAKGEGNSYDFGARMLDPRIGRWLTIDPMFKDQPSQSPYKAFLNSPTNFVDPGGNYEIHILIVVNEKTNKVWYKVTVANSEVMTDGKKHLVFDSQANAHYENNYYDFATVTVQTFHKNGDPPTIKKSDPILMTEKGSQYSETVFFGASKFTKRSTANKKDVGKEVLFGIEMTGSTGADESAVGQDWSKNAVGDVNWEDLSTIMARSGICGGEGYVPGSGSWGSMSKASPAEWLEWLKGNKDTGEKIGEIKEEIEEMTSDGSPQPIENTTARICAPNPNSINGGCEHIQAGEKSIKTGDTLGGVNPQTGKINVCKSIEKSLK